MNYWETLADRVEKAIRETESGAKRASADGVWTMNNMFTGAAVAHALNHTPERVLNRCAGDMVLVDLFRTSSEPKYGNQYEMGFYRAMCYTIETLARSYNVSMEKAS